MEVGGASLNGFVGAGGRGLGVKVWGGKVLGAGDDDDGDEDKVLASGLADANVVPHLELPPLNGNEASLAIGFGGSDSTVSARATLLI